MYHPPQAIQFPAGMMQVLDHFRGRDEIIGLVHHGRVIRKKRVVNRHFMAGFLKHKGEGWSRTGSKIQAGTVRPQSFFEGLGQPV